MPAGAYSGYGAKMAAIRISGPFRARFFIFVHRATKSEPCSMLNIWLKIRVCRSIGSPSAAAKNETGSALWGLCRQSWARLLQKDYEVDPFVCPKCKGTMSVVAILEDLKELRKIIDWAKKQEKEPQLAVCARSPPQFLRNRPDNQRPEHTPNSRARSRKLRNCLRTKNTQRQFGLVAVFEK